VKRLSRRHKAKSTPVRSFKSYITYYFVSVVSVWLLVGLASFAFTQNPTCANSVSCAKPLTFKIENGAAGEFNGSKVTPPKIDLAMDALKPTVLGTTDAPGQKHIYVDLTHQKLFAFQGDKLIMETLVSTGKWGRTPTGDFAIWIKLRATRMTGGQGDDFYDLPNVEYTMYFYHDFALHGAYWHNNFGHPMSHGCVNMRTEDAHALYDWADPPTIGYSTPATAAHPGTQVTIYGTTPNE
jgi:hypothetical protein